MPFDTTPLSERAKFIEILRNKSCWPKDFEWYYPDQCCCALGLADYLYGDSTEDGLRKRFNLNEADLLVTFFMADLQLGKPSEDITPEDVADLLEGADYA